MLHRSNRRTRGRAIVAAGFILSVLSVSQALAQSNGGGGGGGSGGGSGGGGGGGNGGEGFTNNIVAPPMTPNNTRNKNYLFSFEEPRTEPCWKLRKNAKCH